MLKKFLQPFLKSKPAANISLIIVGSLIWSLTMVKSGLVYGYGMGFWGPNGHDGVWHIAVIENLARGSLEMPVFSGASLQNYHIGFDLLVTAIHKITFIPVVNLYFQILPPVLALLVGISVFRFVYFWQKDRAKAYWSTFFVYFGGSFGWIVTLFQKGGIGGESLFWSQQSISTLVNPPFALSLVLLFSGLTLLQNGIKNNNKKKLMLATFLFGTLVQVKVYAGVLALGALVVAGLYNMIVRRKGIGVLKVFTGALIISVLIFTPLNKGVSGSIIYKPFWFLETMMQLSDRFYWPRFAEAMVNYRSGNVWVKAMPAYGFAFLLFLIGNLGTRLLSFAWFAQKLKRWNKLSSFDIFFISLVVAGIVAPTFFLQSGTPWNTIQFFYYTLIFSGIIAGISFVEMVRSFKFSKAKIYAIESILVLLTIPTTIGTLRHYLPQRPPAKISNEELSALNFLSKQPNGIVLTFPFDKYKAQEAISNPPRPLYLYESTAYVSAFSQKPVYLEDEVNLDITGYDWPARRNSVEYFLQSSSINEVRSFLKDNNISYIYWLKGQRALLGESQLGIESIFENDAIDIYRVI